MSNQVIITPSKAQPNTMHWRCFQRGIHKHVVCYINGAKAGDLAFRNEEFLQVYLDAHRSGNITFENGE